MALRREIHATVRLAAPVVLVQLGMMAMGTVDVMMLGRVSEVAMASGALGYTVAMALYVFPMGFLMGIDPLIAQAHGAGDVARKARFFRQGVVLAVLLALPISLLMWQSRPLLDLLGQPPEIFEGASIYMRVVVPSNLATLLFVVVRQTLQAMSIVRPTAIAIVIGNVVNFAVNWLLIFGNWGFPRLGVAGAAWAMTLSRWAMAVWLIVAARAELRRLWAERVDDLVRPRSYATFLRLGLPVGAQISLEMWLFAGATLMMGHLGAVELAGHQVAINLSALAFMVPLGIAGAAATRVGNAIGRADKPGARRAALVCLGLGATVMSVSGLVFLTFPRFLAHLYTPETSVVSMAATLLPIASLFQVFDGLQVVGAGVLRGTADTRGPAVIALIGYWFVGLPLGAWLSFGLGLGPRGLWLGLTLALFSVAMLLLARIRYRFRGEIVAVG